MEIHQASANADPVPYAASGLPGQVCPWHHVVLLSCACDVGTERMCAHLIYPHLQQSPSLVDMLHRINQLDAIPQLQV